MAHNNEWRLINCLGRIDIEGNRDCRLCKFLKPCANIAKDLTQREFGRWYQPRKRNRKDARR